MYLEKRRRVWYALQQVPADVRDKIGTRRLCVSLKTTDKKVAERRAAWHEQQWLHQIEIAREGTRGSLEADALYWRSQLERASPEEREMLEWHVSELADEYMLGAPIKDPLHPEFDTQPQIIEKQRFYGIATGQLVRTDERIEEWLTTKPTLVEKTRNMYRATLKDFSERFVHVDEINRKAVREWVNDLQLREGLAPKTIQRILSTCRGYWKYLGSLEVVPEDLDPFASAVDHRRNASGASSKRSGWLPFESSDVTRLLSAALDKGDTDLANLIQLGMWTGCRIEELCSLSVAKTTSDYIEIEDAKTDAGWRRVPVHSKLSPLLARLARESVDGFIMSGLSRNMYKARSNAIGKRFGRLKKALGYSERFTFHSIRKTVVTQLERAGVPENVTADIVGHEKPRITYGVYSGGNSLAILSKAIEKLDYPADRPSGSY